MLEAVVRRIWKTSSSSACPPMVWTQRFPLKRSIRSGLWGVCAVQRAGSPCRRTLEAGLGLPGRRLLPGG
ncbi:MAG: hypothetical protein J6P53_04510, partial [Mailhella sp.]|nr:hypothetical protein [Mailhella sp.]